MRSTLHSRFCPWFSQKPLAAALSAAGIGYIAMGEALGGRPRRDTLYRDGAADYDLMAIQPKMLPAWIGCSKSRRGRAFVSTCASVPLDCHRCLLVARSLAERGVAVAHILHDGAVEAHIETELRLLALDAKTVSRKPATCSRLDSTTEAPRQRIVAGYVPSCSAKASAPRNIAER